MPESIMHLPGRSQRHKPLPLSTYFRMLLHANAETSSLHLRDTKLTTISTMRRLTFLYVGVGLTFWYGDDWLTFWYGVEGFTFQ